MRHPGAGRCANGWQTDDRTVLGHGAVDQGQESHIKWRPAAYPANSHLAAVIGSPAVGLIESNAQPSIEVASD
jgi:hypothetical protein